MTPQRLEFVLEQLFRRNRSSGDRAGHHNVIAHLLGIDPRTLRRWRRGEAPVSRCAAIVLEISYAYPQIDGAEIERLLAGKPKK